MTTVKKKIIKVAIQTLINVLTALLTVLGANAAVIH